MCKIEHLKDLSYVSTELEWWYLFGVLASLFVFISLAIDLTLDDIQDFCRFFFSFPFVVIRQSSHGKSSYQTFFYIFIPIQASLYTLVRNRWKYYQHIVFKYVVTFIFIFPFSSTFKLFCVQQRSKIEP